ncbi:MAG: hypothetical protein ACRDIX_03590 [Actinomycetota bacterium]
MSGAHRPSRPTGLGVVLGATLLTLAFGYLLKLPCLTGPWDGRQYTRLCYSDVMALSAIGEDGTPPAVEAEKYPAGANYLMRLVSLPATSFVSFFNWTALLWTVAALFTSWMLYRLVGMKALFFAGAPTLLIYGYMNWDLPLVALATVGTAAYLRGRDGPAGAFLGLASAVKVPYPGFLVVPFAAWRARDRTRADGRRLAGAAALAWVAVNLPFALVAPGRWFFAFQFNAGRSADWDTGWFLLQRHLGFRFPPAALNLLALLAFLAACAAVWRLAMLRNPRFEWWTLGFAFAVCYLLTGKVFSPQWTLWLLPWFVLVLPDWRLFVAFEAANAAVFVTRFLWFARLSGVGGVPFAAFEIALIVRAVVLVACVVAWLRTLAPDPSTPSRAVSEAA